MRRFWSIFWDGFCKGAAFALACGTLLLIFGGAYRLFMWLGT